MSDLVELAKAFAASIPTVPGVVNLYTAISAEPVLNEKRAQRYMAKGREGLETHLRKHPLNVRLAQIGDMQTSFIEDGCHRARAYFNLGGQEAPCRYVEVFEELDRYMLEHNSLVPSVPVLPSPEYKIALKKYKDGHDAWRLQHP